MRHPGDFSRVIAMRITIDDIRSAAADLTGQVIRTPSIESRVLSELCGTDIVLKLENLQVTGSFKLGYRSLDPYGQFTGPRPSCSPNPVLKRRSECQA
jgi:hypothetical protein